MSSITEMKCWDRHKIFRVINIVTDELERQIKKREIFVITKVTIHESDRHLHLLEFNAGNDDKIQRRISLLYSERLSNDRFSIVEYDPERRDEEGRPYPGFRFPADHPLIFPDILPLFREWLNIAVEEPFDQRDAKFEKILDMKQQHFACPSQEHGKANVRRLRA